MSRYKLRQYFSRASPPVNLLSMDMFYFDCPLLKYQTNHVWKYLSYWHGCSKQSLSKINFAFINNLWTHFGRITSRTNHHRSTAIQSKMKITHWTHDKTPDGQTNYILQTTRKEITGKTSKTLVWDRSGPLGPTRSRTKIIYFARQRQTSKVLPRRFEVRQKHVNGFSLTQLRGLEIQC
jgi:hypothetical protein